MRAVDYPWRWLADSLGMTFTLRYPWVNAVRQAAGAQERVCLLLPEAAGSLADWGAWVSELLGQHSPILPLTAPGNFPELTRVLTAAYQVEENGFTDGRPADWSRGFLATCRRQMPQVDTVGVIVVGPDAHCAAALHDLVEAQRALGYQFVRPVLLCRRLPAGWRGEVVRFGLPEPAGDLHRIDPPPERDLSFWTNLVLALTVAWEAGAVPGMADELWEQLRLGRSLSLRDAGFDAWLDRQLNQFARGNAAREGPPLDGALAFGPLAEVEDKLWQAGSVAWQDGHFDVTPLRARLWVEHLADDAREALRRRRLTNVPLARWLSAWATSVEESLRVAVLQAGGPKFRRFLQEQPPRNRRDTQARSRWDELGPADAVTAIDSADFGDLAAFVAQAIPRARGTSSLATLLDQCRLARNRVVHERRLSASDLLRITAAVDWLAENGLI
jgi:hypothetical protein